MADCATCPYHVDQVRAITEIRKDVDHTREILNIQVAGLQVAREQAKEEMERRLEGMNGLEARSNARIVDAEARARETTNKAEKKLEDQAKEFIKNAEFRAEMKVVESKIGVLSGMANEKKGEKKWSDHIITVLIALGVMVIFKVLKL